MKKLLLILLCLPLLFSSCRKCIDCTLILEMESQITINKLDSIAQTIPNDYGLIFQSSQNMILSTETGFFDPKPIYHLHFEK